jgi:alkylation response protein AidB-like acyl-CoA dehydrogenase
MYYNYLVPTRDVCFLRLVGGRDEGIHGVLVRIRDDNLKVMPGVTVEDMGYKMGLNGVDNAKLSFDHVRTPRENLLNALSDVDAKGRKKHPAHDGPLDTHRTT